MLICQTGIKWILCQDLPRKKKCCYTRLPCSTPWKLDYDHTIFTFLGCDNIVISGTTDDHGGTYTYIYNGCSLSRRVYYNSGGYYLYYYSSSLTAIWAVSDIVCDTAAYIAASSTAEFPENVTAHWIAYWTREGIEYTTILQVACKGLYSTQVNILHVQIWDWWDYY